MHLSSIHSTIAIIIFSWSMGFLTYYILSDSTKAEKKASMEEIAGQLIHFVIFLWIGKIILNLNIFIIDPLAILAYPSDSYAFYFAILLSGFTIVIQYKRRKIDALPFSIAFIYIFLTASFVYEFMQVIWNKNIYSIGYLSLIALLIITFVVLRNFVHPHWLNLLILLGWSIGSLSLAMIKPILMVFGYTIAPWFLVFILIICCGLMVYQKMKAGVVHGRN